MKKFVLGMTCAALTISTIALTGVIIPKVKSSNVQFSVSGDTTFDPIPPELLEDHKHPSMIYTKDGIFVKANEKGKFTQEEIVYDSQNTTDNTKMIVNEYGDIYIKEGTTLSNH